MYIYKGSSLLFTLISLCLVALISGYTYEEIQKLNASCSPKDTCAIPRDLDHHDSHNCDCGGLCVLYDTCCIDSPVLNLSSKYDRPASCRSIGHENHVFMVDSCPATYHGPMAIRRRCEAEVMDWSDPFGHIPATHPFSQTTYKSLFCAFCNGKKLQELIMWNVIMDCSALGDGSEKCTQDRDFVVSNMVYLHEKSQWGIWSFDPKTDWGFKTLTLHLQAPDSIKKYVKGCRPNLVSDCKPGWRDERVWQLCKAYMGAIYVGDASYRNIHCAICNNVKNVTFLMSCHDSNEPTFRGAMNFGVLLDIDLTDGNKVGTVETKCSTDQVYDPFAKKCRNIECALPGYVVKNQKCAPL